MYNCTDKFEKLIELIAWTLHNNPKACSCNIMVGAEYQKVRCCRRTIKIDNAVLVNDLHPLLLKALQSLGGVGTVVNGNTLGYCAEIHAANGILKQQDASGITLNQIRFSNAFRPRNMMPNPHTKGVIPYCKNCLNVFNIRN